MRECVRACLRALLQYKALDTVLYMWPTWEQGWLRSDSSFFAYHLRWTYIPKTHTRLQKIKKIPINFMWRGYYYAEISLHKAIVYHSVSNIYIALSIKIPFLSKTSSFFIPKPVVLFVNERII